MRNISNTHAEFIDYNGFSSSRKVIYYVGGACSSGKTYQICSYVEEHCQETNFLIVCPSTRLGEQTAKELRGRGINVHSINTSTHPRQVRRQIIEEIKEAPESGLVMVVTWQAYVELPYVPGEKNFQVIIDEIPQLDTFYPLRLLPENVKHITDWVEVVGSVNERVGVVEALDEGKLERYLEKQGDDVKDLFTGLLRDVASPNKVVYVDLRSWNRVIEKRRRGKTNQENTVYFLSLLDHKFLYNSIMLGANFENSLLYYRFRKCGVRFEEFNEISQRLRPVETGSRDIEICYFLEGSYFSKSKGRKCLGEEGTLVEVMDNEAVSYFDGGPFLYVVNNDRKSRILEAAPNARRISVYSHGLNCYDDCHNIYFSAALNRSPQHFKMLGHLGFDADHVHSATAHEVAYQAAMRLSLRRPEETHPVRILVPDAFMAARVAGLLGVKEIHRIGDIDLGVPYGPLSPSQRNRRSKTKKLVDELFAPKRLHFPLIADKRHQNGTNVFTQSSNFNQCFVTLHKTTAASCDEQFVEQEFEWQAFINILRASSKTPVKDKAKDTFLFNPAIFDPSIDKSGYRRKANFVGSCMLVLDFDNGNLSPEEFEDIFWHKAGRGLKRSFIICNSFSRSSEQPNRFRVIFLFKKPACSIAEHEAVFNSIVERLEGEGFTVKDICLDRQCKTGIQSFFMPCTNHAHPEYAFFRAHGTKTRDIERYGIDPAPYLIHAKPEKPRLRKLVVDGDVPTALSPELEKKKATLMGMTENRHDLLYEFARGLAFHFKREASMVEMHLGEVAGNDRKMGKKVKDCLKSLQRWGHS